MGKSYVETLQVARLIMIACLKGVEIYLVSCSPLEVFNLPEGTSTSEVWMVKYRLF